MGAEGGWLKKVPPSAAGWISPAEGPGIESTALHRGTRDAVIRWAKVVEEEGSELARGRPLVSVVKSVYNGAAYLTEAPLPTLQDFELIVVDDGSADMSWDILQATAAADPRVVLLRNEVNSGSAASQNSAIAQCRGPLIALQDQDDISLPKRLERQVEYLRSNLEVGLVGVWPQFVDACGRPLENRFFRLAEGNDGLQVRLLQEPCICGTSVMVRRQWLEAADPYDPSMRAAEDCDLLLRVAEVTRLANVTERLYLYRDHADSVSHRNGFLQRLNRGVALERALGRRHGSDLPAPRAEIAADYRLRAAFFGLVEGGIAEVHSCVSRAIDLAPWISQRGNQIEETLGRYVFRQRFEAPLALVDQMFQGFLPPTRHLQRVRARLISRTHMRVVFEGADPTPQPDKSLLPRSTASHLWPGVRSNPSWVSNRGVWSTTLHHLAGRPVRLRT